MKAVLISIQPKWCELIASGEKTIEVRKTKPNIKVPFKVYIYCTKDNTFAEKTLRGFDDNGKAIYYKANKGKVIGEFVCEHITYLGNISTDKWAYLIGWSHEYRKRLVTNNACLTEEELLEYGGKYAWHISNLVIYDKPKELSEFLKINRDCWYADLGLAKRDCSECQNKDCFIQRPPQSWCYVESVGADQ